MIVDEALQYSGVTSGAFLKHNSTTRWQHAAKAKAKMESVLSNSTATYINLQRLIYSVCGNLPLVVNT